MNQLRPGMPELPERMRALPVTDKGYPVPKFVEWIDGKPDFRIMNSSFLARAVEHGLCWICGVRLAKKRAFVIGPMCAINRVSSEPPSHPECAIFAARACPFLTMPKMRRREAGLPDGTTEAAGLAIKRNPGVALVWVTRGWKPVHLPDGMLFDVGQPLELHWFTEGRIATRVEILASIESGKPILEESARSEGPAAMQELERLVARAMELLPPAAQANHFEVHP